MARTWRNSSYEFIIWISSICSPLTLQQVLWALLVFASLSLQTILCAAALMAQWNPSHILLLRTLRGLFLSVTQDPVLLRDPHDLALFCLPDLVSCSASDCFHSSQNGYLAPSGKALPSRASQSWFPPLSSLLPAICARVTAYFKGSHQRGLPWPSKIAVPLPHTQLLNFNIDNHPVFVCVCVLSIFTS